jgi:hypothetical protein
MLGKLARIPSLWPKTVKLRVSWTFTLIFEGKPSGSFDAPAGAVVTVLKVKGSNLLVADQEGQAELPAKYTNIGNVVNAQAIIDAPTPPPDPTPAPISTNEPSAASITKQPPPSSPATITAS